MIEWWNSLLTLQQVYLLFAIPATLILIIQTIMLFIGMDDDDIETDSDFSGDDGLALFTVRGFVSMFCVMGWAGFALLGAGVNVWVSILVSLLLGLATLIGMAFLMRAVNHLQSSGNIQISNAIGKVGQVYIPIPAGAVAAGKVNLTVQDRFAEFAAITLGDAQIPTGAYVRVVAVDDAGTLVVEPVSQTKKD